MRFLLVTLKLFWSLKKLLLIFQRLLVQVWPSHFSRYISFIDVDPSPTRKCKNRWLTAIPLSVDKFLIYLFLVCQLSRHGHARKQATVESIMAVTSLFIWTLDFFYLSADWTMKNSMSPLVVMPPSHDRYTWHLQNPWTCKWMPIVHFSTEDRC